MEVLTVGASSSDSSRLKTTTRTATAGWTSKSLQRAAARNQEKKVLATCKAEANAASAADASPMPNASSLFTGLGVFIGNMVRGGTTASGVTGFLIGNPVRPVVNANLRAMAYSNTYSACVARVTGGAMVVNPGP